MNNPCISCKKEIHYYAGFCHHCESKQPRKEPKYGEKQRYSFWNWWAGGGIQKVEKYSNGFEINREYNRTSKEIIESWIDKEGIEYHQTWDNNPHELQGFIITNNTTSNYYFVDNYLYRKTEFIEEGWITTQYYNRLLRIRSIENYIERTNGRSHLIELTLFTPKGDEIGKLGDWDIGGKLIMDYDEDGNHYTFCEHYLSGKDKHGYRIERISRKQNSLNK